MRLALAILLALVGTGCGPTPHAISLDAELRVQANQVNFMTPAGSVASVTPASIIGKPYFAAVFPAAFSPGIDPPLHYGWGRVGSDLRVRWTTPADLKDAPYDLVLVIYVVSPIADSMYGTNSALVPLAGDIATFTIEAKDPPLSAGQLRVQLAGADAEVVTWNKWSRDLSAGIELFTDTLLLVP